MVVKTLEEEMMDEIGKQIAKEIDDGIIANMLVETGWTPVHFTFKDSEQAVDIAEWLSETCEEDTYGRYGSEYLFKDKQDAEWFILRWV
jgi:hypothetical protein